MDFDISLWQRFEHNNVAVYVRGDMPSWFVPNSAGDQLLQQLMSGEEPALQPQQQAFMYRLPTGTGAAYTGRFEHLQTDKLSELWLHITNRCDLSCRHCLFASGPKAVDELSYNEIVTRVDEAIALGCKVFALTGGEPFCHPRFIDIIHHIQSYSDVHVAVLSNGMSLRPVLEQVDLDWSRFHLQLSVDGLEPRHDHIRGMGSFAALQEQMGWLRAQGHSFTLSMCVEQDNLADMPELVDLAVACGAANLHFMWYFIRGRGSAQQYVAPEQLFAPLKQAWLRAQDVGISIDNIDALKTQLFAPTGTIHDGGGSGWHSIAIGPDGKLYPSAAMVGIAELATDITATIATAWRQSNVLDVVRRSSCAGMTSPWRYLLGGGDGDHSYMFDGTFIGNDPYLPLYQLLALELIVENAQRFSASTKPALRLKMGDCLSSCAVHGKVALLHSNCLLALTNDDSRSVVKEFYAAAVGDTKEDILNPVCYEAAVINHIPPQFRLRGYGCGSPVLDAEIVAGETILDLGCGSGVECFIAARLTGRTGSVIGVDMLEPMLALARRGGAAVAQNLGYDNLDFRQGFLEQLPVADNSVDLILSNCVLNLSADKRQLFAEMLRVLKPGGRLVVADVVCETEPDAAIRNDAVLHGECIAGALTQKDLLGLLNESGFTSFSCLKRVPYRVVQKHQFFSMTFRANKMGNGGQIRESEALTQRVRVMYPGPFPQLTLADGRVVVPGQVFEISTVDAAAAGDQLYQLDGDGRVVNVTFSDSCNCALPPNPSVARSAALLTSGGAMKHNQGCMVCGAPLLYDAKPRQRRCHYCGSISDAAECCEQGGHYVCDKCHSLEALQVIENICLHTTQCDMLTLFQQVRSHPAIPLHGPQYHSLVPAIILTAYRNSGAQLDFSVISSAIKRGAQVVGGSCAYNGVCGAATGVGIAFSIIIEANPLKGVQRRMVQNVVQQVLAELATFEAARCCNRDCVMALCLAAKLSVSILPIPLHADNWQKCQQQHLNSDCLGAGCPLSSAKY